MRITKRTNIAIRVLMFCAANNGRLVTKSEIADRCNASENHLAQVINQLGQLGYLRTQRGRNGGIQLGRSTREIQIGEVFRELESSVPIAECFADVDNTCPLVDACRLKLAIAGAAWRSSRMASSGKPSSRACRRKASRSRCAGL